MPLTRVEIEKFNKVLIVYNQNSGKQFFASMFARVNEVYKRLKDIYGSKRIDIYDVKSFADLDDIAEYATYYQVSGKTYIQTYARILIRHKEQQ